MTNVEVRGLPQRGASAFCLRYSTFDIRYCLWVLVLFLSFVAPAASSAAAPASAPAGDPNQVSAAVRRDTAWLAARDSRMPGSAGHQEALRWLEAAAAALPPDRVKVWKSTFPVVVPLPAAEGNSSPAHLAVPSGPQAGKHRVYPLWPCGVRLNTTPAEGIAGRLVYIGKGEPQQLHPKLLPGQIAVMEMSGGERWREAFALGARAMILLGSQDVNFRAAGSHLLPLPMYLPRFFVPEGALAQALREGAVPEGTLHCAADWVETPATNLYVLIRPREGPPPGSRALVVAARYDGMSVVPDLAPDADGAVDAATALALLRDLAARPPRKPVLVAFLDGYGINQMGMRQMLADLAVPLSAARDLLKEDRRRVEDEYRLPAELAKDLLAGGTVLERISQDRYEPLRRYVKDEVDRDVIAVDASLYPLRLRLYEGPSPAQKEALRGQIAEQEARRQGLYAVLAQMTEPRSARQGAAQPVAAARRAMAHPRWPESSHGTRTKLDSG